jgi:hypothetical protein
MEWRAYVQHTLGEMKKTNPNATLKQAMVASSEGWKSQQDALYKVRDTIVWEERKRATSKKKSAAQKAKHADKADRVEATKCGGVLKNMRSLDEWY